MNHGGLLKEQQVFSRPQPCPSQRVESVLESSFTGSITEVVTPHIGWDGDGLWVVDVGAGTDILTIAGEDLMKSSCKRYASWDYVHV